MRIAVYVRVSTQTPCQTQSIEYQLQRLRAYVQTQGWDLPDDHVFRDDGYSGASLNRPGLDRLRERIAQRAFDRVLITAPDRLARKYVHQVLLLEEFEQHDCQTDFLERPMSQDPHDQLVLQIRGAVAEYERSLITDRMRRGRQAKLRAGLLLPWTRPPYGYRVDPDRPRDPQGVRLEPAEAATVAEMAAYYLEDRQSVRLGQASDRHGHTDSEWEETLEPSDSARDLDQPGVHWQGLCRTQPSPASADSAFGLETDGHPDQWSRTGTARGLDFGSRGSSHPHSGAI